MYGGRGAYSNLSLRQSWIMIALYKIIWQQSMSHFLMDNLSERGNSSPESNNIKSLSCDKWQDSETLRKPFMCQLSCLWRSFPTVVGFICRVKQPAVSLDTALNLCQLQCPHKSLWPLHEVIGARDEWNRWTREADAQNCALPGRKHWLTRMSEQKITKPLFMTGGKDEGWVWRRGSLRVRLGER